MANEWADVNLLIQQLAAVAAAAAEANVTETEKAAIKAAIADAAVAVSRTVAEHREAALKTARHRIDIAEEVLATFDGALAQARNLQAAATPLCARALELVGQARRLQTGR